MPRDFQPDSVPIEQVRKEISESKFRKEHSSLFDSVDKLQLSITALTTRLDDINIKLSRLDEDTKLLLLEERLASKLTIPKAQGDGIKASVKPSHCVKSGIHFSKSEWFSLY
jgi:regulator of replication initiation timing